MADALRGSHSFVDLTDGRCHYRIDGPHDGVPLLLLHGATVPGWEFDRLVPFLTSAGYQVLLPDLFGHGYSDRPRVEHGYSLFVNQLRDFIDYIAPGQPPHIMGHSLGAVVGARLVVQSPSSFGSLVLGAPMLDFLGQTIASRLLNVPVLGEALVHGYIVPMLVRRRTRRYSPIEDGRFVGKFRDQVAYPGFGRALLSLMRSGALADQSETYRQLAATEKRVLLLRGAEDTILSCAQFATLSSLLGRAEAVTIPDTAHAMVLSHPEQVAPHVTAFLGNA